MSKFKNMVKSVATAGEMKVEKQIETKAPKKEEKVGSLKVNKEVAAIQDMMFILKSAKEAKGMTLSAKDLEMFANEIQEKAATTVSDVAELIPSGFSGKFIQDAFAATSISDVFPFEQISTFGMTDTIGDFNMTAYIVDELGTPADSNDIMDNFEYRGGKLFAKTYISYEALNDATIDMLSNKRAGLVRALAVGIEQAILNGQAGDAGVAANDARMLFRGLRKLGLTKKAVDFGGTMTEATLRAGILKMVEEGGLYTSWEEIDAGNVVVFMPTKVYNGITNFESFVDASKAGIASTLSTGRRVSSVFGIPVITSRFFPSAVTTAGVVSVTPTNNTAQSIIMVNINTFKTYSIAGSALAESFRDVEVQRVVLTQSLRLGAGSIFDQTSANPTAINTSKVNVVAGVNIIA